VSLAVHRSERALLRGLTALRSAIAGRSGWLLAGETVNRACRFLLLLVLARLLGVDGFASWVIAIATGTIIAQTADLGLVTAVTVGVARAKADTRKYVAGVWGVAPVLAAVAALFVLLLAPLLATSNAILLFVLVGWAGVAESVAVLLLSPLRGHEDFRPEGTIRATHGAALLLLGGGVAVATSAATLPVSVTVIAISMGSLLLAAAASIRAFGFVRPALDLSLQRRLFAAALPVFGATAVFFIYFRIDTYLLALLSGSEATALYGAAFNLAFGLSFLPLLYARSMLAPFSTPSARQLRTAYAHAAAVTCALVLAITTGLLIIAPAIALLYGAGFAVARSAYLILLAAQAVYLFTHLNAMVFFARGRSGTMWLLSLFALATNVAANVMLIPPYGASGAAAAMVISEAVLLAAQALFLRGVLSTPASQTDSSIPIRPPEDARRKAA
jgi:O-antigen/teichoic acid export membrane protein